MTMFPSACIWAYRIPITQALREIKETAFHYVDVETDLFEKPDAVELLKKLGLKIACVALDHKLQPGSSLNAGNAGALRNAVVFIKKALEQSQAFGAQAAYVAPCADRKNLKSFAAAMKELAEDAAARGIRFCVEHVPGSALPSAKEALAFMETVSHPNMHVVLDVGHALISKEKPSEIVAAAGKRIGYVQLSDNDGKADRHWPLLEGKLTAEELSKTLEQLQTVGYEGALGLELKHDRASLVSVFSRNRNLLLRLQTTAEIKSLKEPEARRKK